MANSPSKKPYQDLEDNSSDAGATNPLLGGGKAGYGAEVDSDSEKSFNVTNDQYYMGVDKKTLFDTPEEGLTEEEAARRLQMFGKNELTKKEENIWLKLALEFVQPMPLMIWAAIFILRALLHG